MIIKGKTRYRENRGSPASKTLNSQRNTIFLLRAARDQDLPAKPVIGVERESGGYHTDFMIDEAGTSSEKNCTLLIFEVGV